MSTTSKINGACRCGKLKFTVSAPPLLTAACHCAGCQKMSGSAFSLTTIVSTQAFTVQEGQPVIGGLHGAIRHNFCDHCLSWVFTRPDGFDHIVNVRTPMLERPGEYPPYIETFTSDKLPWVTTGAVKSYEFFPQAEEFESLLREYGARNA